MLMKCAMPAWVTAFHGNACNQEQEIYNKKRSAELKLYTLQRRSRTRKVSYLLFLKKGSLKNNCKSVCVYRPIYCLRYLKGKTSSRYQGAFLLLFLFYERRLEIESGRRGFFVERYACFKRGHFRAGEGKIQKEKMRKIYFDFAGLKIGGGWGGVYSDAYIISSYMLYLPQERERYKIWSFFRLYLMFLHFPRRWTYL